MLVGVTVGRVGFSYKLFKASPCFPFQVSSNPIGLKYSTKARGGSCRENPTGRFFPLGILLHMTRTFWQKES